MSHVVRFDDPVFEQGYLTALAGFRHSGCSRDDCHDAVCRAAEERWQERVASGYPAYARDAGGRVTVDRVAVWIKSRAHWRAVDRIRELDREIPDDAGMEAADLRDPDEDGSRAAAAALRDLVRLVRAGRLSRRDARLLGYLVLDFSHGEIGPPLEMTPNAVKTAVHRARRRLQSAGEQM